MNDTLSVRFQKTKGLPITVNGHSVLPIVQMQIAAKYQRCVIRRLRATQSPAQGLRIKAIKGEMEVNDQIFSDVILWADTSPDTVEMTILSNSGCELKVWNVWRVEDLAQAWVGNAGIVAGTSGHVTTLECSDGIGEIDFSDLIVQIEVAMD